MSTTGCNPKELFEAYEKPILRHIRRKTPDDAVAEDIASELWVRVVGYAERFENNGSVKAWLYKIADNLVSDFWGETLLPEDGTKIKRKRTERLSHLPKRDCEILGNRGVGKDEEEDGQEYDPRDRCPSPEAWLLALERDETVDVILRQIDAPSRAVLKYRLQGLSLSEIAEKTNTPLSAVKARFYRSKSKLSETAVPTVRPGDKANNLRCGSIECRPEKWVFYAGK
jgi:RNA polymerase sigma factor (sigma-70 family)